MSNEAHEYNVKVNWIHGRTGKFIIGSKPEITFATPPEFGGPEGIVSPEDLFVGSATSCLMTTFVTFTGKMRFDFKSFTCEGKGTLERVGKGFQFTKIELKAHVVVASQDLVPKAERALELAGKYCLVSNSMKCPTEHQNSVSVG